MQALPLPPDAAEVDVLCAGRVLTATPSLTTPTLSLTLILSLSPTLTLTPTLALTLALTLILTRWAVRRVASAEQLRLGQIARRASPRWATPNR